MAKSEQQLDCIFLYTDLFALIICTSIYRYKTYKINPNWPVCTHSNSNSSSKQRYSEKVVLFWHNQVNFWYMKHISQKENPYCQQRDEVL